MNNEETLFTKQKNTNIYNIITIVIVEMCKHLPNRYLCMGFIKKNLNI